MDGQSIKGKTRIIHHEDITGPDGTMDGDGSRTQQEQGKAAPDCHAAYPRTRFPLLPGFGKDGTKPEKKIAHSFR